MVRVCIKRPGLNLRSKILRLLVSCRWNIIIVLRVVHEWGHVLLLSDIGLILLDTIKVVICVVHRKVCWSWLCRNLINSLHRLTGLSISNLIRVLSLI